MLLYITSIKISQNIPISAEGIYVMQHQTPEYTTIDGVIIKNWDWKVSQLVLSEKKYIKRKSPAVINSFRHRQQ